MLLLPFLAACSPAPKDSDAPGDTADTAAPSEAPGTTVRGDAARITAPSDADVGTLGVENADFSFDVLRGVYGAAPGNLVLSPWSLQTVMAQVYAGASGDAKTAIASTFRWSLAEPQIHEAFDAAALMIEAHDAPAADPPLSITSVNQVFVTDGYTLGADWLDVLSAYYGTGVQVMDFAADPAGVAADINAWISSSTGGRIEDLISAGMVSDSRMLLVNALYLKASWYVPFQEASTSDQDFTLGDGTTVAVPTMSGMVNVWGGAGDGYFVAELPFSDNGLVMTLVLPDAGRFDTLAGNLEWSSVQAVIDAEAFCEECQVSLPKFEVKSTPDVQGALIALGMQPAFGGTYEGINPALTLTGVDQQAFVLVNEIGTEAAAATVAEFSDSASEPPFGPVVVDRPFFWFVREPETGSILFAGVVVDPR